MFKYDEVTNKFNKLGFCYNNVNDSKIKVQI